MNSKEQIQRQKAMQKAFPTSVSGIKKQWSDIDKMAKMSPEQFEKKYRSPYNTGQATGRYEDFRKTWRKDPLEEKYNLMKQAGELRPSDTFERFAAMEADKQKRISDFEKRMKAKRALNPLDEWTIGDGKYTRRGVGFEESGDYLGNSGSSFQL
jgi:hypothetical protein